jgi:hypothetical protein
MKAKLVVTLIAVILSTATVWAARRGWYNFKRPPVSLGLAHQLCLDDLRQRYGKDAGDYYCVRAKIQHTFTEADWELKFFKEGSKSDGVAYSVGSDHSVRFAEGGFEY